MARGHAIAVTPNDSTDLPFVTRSVYVGGTGTLTVTMDSGVDVQFSAIPVGTVLDINCKRIKATGTSATLIVAIF